MFIPYKKDNKVLANNLRRNITPEEKKLWYQCLRLFPVRFNKQKRLGNYIVDFYCHKARIVIELDGEQHYEEEAIIYDQQRTKYLEQFNILVLRYTNRELKANFKGVCEDIENTLKQRLKEFGLNDNLWDK